MALDDETKNTDEPNPNWLDEFEELANDQLGAGSACEQVHPIIQRWYEALGDTQPPASRDSVLQAMACLSTEIMNDTPDQILDEILDVIDEDALAGFIEYVLMVGRAFESALRAGELDDL
jgi:hypothetical protein